MTTHTTFLLPHLSTLFFFFFLLLSASSAADNGITRGAPVIREICGDTNYKELCVSSLLAHPGSSNVLFKDLGPLATDVVLQHATGTRDQIATTSGRRGLHPSSKWALQVCQRQYEMTISNLEQAMEYMKSSGFAETYEYAPVESHLANARENFERCGETMRKQGGVGMPLRKRNESSRRLADNAFVIVGDLMV